MKKSDAKIRVALILNISVGAVLLALFLPPIPQDLAYHAFVDVRKILGVQNFLNVVSNAPFLILSMAGLRFLFDRRRNSTAFMDQGEALAYGVFFAGVGLVALGSSYYHFAPSNATLVWDRLPMTVAFMSLCATIVTERISLRAGRWLLWPLVALGIASVLYWRYTELAGRGDLRFYGLVQFLPMLVLPLVAWLFSSRYTHTGYLGGVIGWYVLAKVLEALDAHVFVWSGFVSGHTLKHIASACACWWILKMLRLRQSRMVPADDGSSSLPFAQTS